MKVKICGITSLEDAKMCCELGADMIGFVHVPGRERSMTVDKIFEICSSLDPTMTKVLVCAPQDLSEALHLFVESGADILQTYSLEPSDLIELRDKRVEVFRVVPPDRSEATRFSKAADALVFENGRPGTGSSYDYTTIPIDCCAKAIVAGGLTIENLHLAKALGPYALDVSSGVEGSSGKKDPELVAEFIRRCHE
jgi:phosphoribosylanthranilate isomerase